MDISKMGEKESCVSLSKQLAADLSEIQLIRVDENMSMDKEMAIPTSSYVISSENYKALLENLYIARLWFIRARNIAANQLDVYKEEASKHMQEINRIIQEELENPEASADMLAQELIKAGTEVIEHHQALNRIEVEELVKNMENLLNTIKADVREVKSLAEPQYEKETNKSSYVNLILDYGHWCLFLLYVSIVLIMGLSNYLPELEKYL